MTHPSHILLGFQIVFGVLSLACGIYGLGETKNALRKGRIGFGQAFTGDIFGIVFIVVGGACALIGVVVLIAPIFP